MSAEDIEERELHAAIEASKRDTKTAPKGSKLRSPHVIQLISSSDEESAPPCQKAKKSNQGKKRNKLGQQASSGPSKMIKAEAGSSEVRRSTRTVNRPDYRDDDDDEESRPTKSSGPSAATSGHQISAAAPLSEYERQRAERIKQNNAVMASIGIPAARGALKIPSARDTQGEDSSTDQEFVPSGANSANDEDTDDGAEDEGETGSTSVAGSAVAGEGRTKAVSKGASEKMKNKKETTANGSSRAASKQRTIKTKTGGPHEQLSLEAFSLFQGSHAEGGIGVDDLVRLAQQFQKKWKHAELEAMVDAFSQHDAKGQRMVAFADFDSLFQEGKLATVLKS